MSTADSHPSALSPRALELFQALPKGMRMQRWRIANIAALIGMSPLEASAARDELVRRGIVEEIKPGEGEGGIEKYEWRVREDWVHVDAE